MSYKIRSGLHSFVSILLVFCGDLFCFDAFPILFRGAHIWMFRSHRFGQPLFCLTSEGQCLSNLVLVFQAQSQIQTGNEDTMVFGSKNSLLDGYHVAKHCFGLTILALCSQCLCKVASGCKSVRVL